MMRSGDASCALRLTPKSAEEQATKFADVMSNLKRLAAQYNPKNEVGQMLKDLVGQMQVSASGKEVFGRLEVPRATVDYVVRRVAEGIQAMLASPQAYQSPPRRAARRRK
ncbi:MAG: hypothetical protein C4334_06830 [Pyrinomonas sp.]